MSEKDPGVSGKKLSKSVKDKILLLVKYRSKLEWHEKEFGW